MYAVGFRQHTFIFIIRESKQIKRGNSERKVRFYQAVIREFRARQCHLLFSLYSQHVPIARGYQERKNKVSLIRFNFILTEN